MLYMVPADTTLTYSGSCTVIKCTTSMRTRPHVAITIVLGTPHPRIGLSGAQRVCRWCSIQGTVTRLDGGNGLRKLHSGSRFLGNAAHKWSKQPELGAAACQRLAALGKDASNKIAHHTGRYIMFCHYGCLMGTADCGRHGAIACLMCAIGGPLPTTTDACRHAIHSRYLRVTSFTLAVVN